MLPEATALFRICMRTLVVSKGMVAACSERVCVCTGRVGRGFGHSSGKEGSNITHHPARTLRSRRATCEMIDTCKVISTWRVAGEAWLGLGTRWVRPSSQLPTAAEIAGGALPP
jgi:hypothetical protein